MTGKCWTRLLFLSLLLTTAPLFCSFAVAQGSQPEDAIDRCIDVLFSQMTIEEKAGQQTQIAAVWWVQPQATQPLITIKPDSNWETSTHLGVAYAALLVDPGYRPTTTTKTLPSQGGKVEAVTIV